MKFDPTAPTAQIKLGGRDYQLVFDVNTFAAYEKATDKFFFDAIFRLVDVLNSFPKTEKGMVRIDPMKMLKAVSITDLRALVWAACHDYDKNDEPVWPLSINQVGRMIHFGNVMPIVSALIAGQTANYPTAEDRVAAGEDQGAQEKTTEPQEDHEEKTTPILVAPLPGDGGGTDSGLQQ